MDRTQMYDSLTFSGTHPKNMPRQTTVKLFETQFEHISTRSTGFLLHSPWLIEDVGAYSSGVHFTTNNVDETGTESLVDGLHFVQDSLVNGTLEIAPEEYEPSDDMLRKFENKFIWYTKCWVCEYFEYTSSHRISHADVQITSTKWIEHTFELR